LAWLPKFKEKGLTMIEFIIGTFLMLSASAVAGYEVAYGRARVGTEPDLYWGGKARWPTNSLTLILLSACNIFMGLTSYFPWFWIGVLFASSATVFLASLLASKCLKKKSSVWAGQVLRSFKRNE
jgi:hypothetical protein